MRASALQVRCSGAGSLDYMGPWLHGSSLKTIGLHKDTTGYFPDFPAHHLLPQDLQALLKAPRANSCLLVNVMTSMITLPFQAPVQLFVSRPLLSETLLLLPPPSLTADVPCQSTPFWASTPMHCWHWRTGAVQVAMPSAEWLTSIRGEGTFSPSIGVPSADGFPELSCLGSSSGPKQESSLQGGKCLEGLGLIKKGTEQVDRYY